MRRFPKILSTQKGSESVLDESKILVAFRNDPTHKDVLSIAKELKLMLVATEKTDDSVHWIQINHTNKRYWFKTLDGKPIDDNRFADIEKSLGEKVEWIGPVYRNSNSEDLGNYFSPMPHVVLLMKTMNLKIESVAKEFGLVLDETKSKYLTAYYYLVVENVNQVNVFEVKNRLEKLGSDVLYETMPLMKPLCATIPNDPLWANQWDMAQINAPNGWDITTGINSVVICILDEGCELVHPDLQFSESGINLGTMLPTGAPTGNHGTACAGIAAGSFNNSAGVAGVAGNCRIMPVAFQNWTDVEVANGINYATTNGALVISMSFGWNPWNPLIIDPEIQNAFNIGVVMCVATHNYNSTITYPATNPLVIACGASSTDDNRKSPASPDGEGWGSDFGDLVYNGVQTGVSVVAPGVLCPTTDRQGAVGYGAGDYINNFNGTSAATPHVAGLAALIRSQYPTLTNVQVRSIIESSAARVGTVAYAEQSGFPNGTRNQEMGYGRIDIFRALDFADIMIKDWAGDDGTEPSAPPSGNFWDFSDIVVRIFDDNIFNPSNPSQSKSVERGQDNFIYVKVTNNGPRDARNVNVNIRITPYIGLEFIYPNDWTIVDGMHVNPTSLVNNFASIPAGSSVIAKFSISATQVETLYGWTTSGASWWHPCLLSQVTSDNDYAYATADLSFGNIVVRKNNFAQRNLTVIDVLASAGAGLSVDFPFVAGSLFSKNKSIHLNVDKSKLPKGTKVLLNFGDNSKAFPLVDFIAKQDKEKDSIVFIEKTKVKTKIGCCDALITLEKGSKIELHCCDTAKLNIKNIKGGELLVQKGEQLISIANEKAIIDFDSQEGNIYALSLRIEFPSNVAKKENFALSVFQTNDNNQVLGGATAIYMII